MDIINTSTKRQTIVTILKIASFFPLLIYPFIVLANLMSFVGHRSGNEPASLILYSFSFLIFSTLYPVTLIYSLKYNKKNTVIIALLPIIHVIISICLCCLWFSVES